MVIRGGKPKFYNLAQTKHDSVDVMYSVLEDRFENTYLDFLAHNFPEILEEIKEKYGGIPQVVKSRYGDVFAEFDDVHLIDTVSRLSSDEIYEIYLVERERCHDSLLRTKLPRNACRDQSKTQTTRRENSSSSSKHCLPITHFFILHRALLSLLIISRNPHCSIFSIQKIWIRF